MFDFSKMSQVREFFRSVRAELARSKIKSIFFFETPGWSGYKDHRRYMQDGDMYVLMENGQCLIIGYRGIDCLDVCLRPLTPAEAQEYAAQEHKDWFNIVNPICGSRRFELLYTETCSLEYGCITDVALQPVTHNYEKWLGKSMTLTAPTAETFDEVRFYMDNGKSFAIYPEAYGYIFVWSEDTEETTEYPQRGEKDADNERN